MRNMSSILAFFILVTFLLLSSGSSVALPGQSEALLEKTSSKSDAPPPSLECLKTAPPVVVAMDDTKRWSRCNQCCDRNDRECKAKEGTFSRRCQVELDNCLASCRSHGEVPSTWGGGCWVESGRQ